MAQQFGLGRGLSSLIPNRTDVVEDEKPQAEFTKRSISEDLNLSKGKLVMDVDINAVVPNPHQPRHLFDEVKLQELADSIKAHGVIQPLVVSKNGTQYELIAGERRLQASKLAGLKKIPVIIREAGEKEKLELAIVENVQRHDLNAIEEGKAYQKLIDDFQLTQEEVSAKMGKSRSLVANKVRLLSLPIEIQKALVEGRITEGHAKAILALPNSEKQRALFELILKENLTVREAEARTQQLGARSNKPERPQDPGLKDVEEKLVQSLGTRVRVSQTGKGGKIVIEYYSQEELAGLLGKLV